MSFTLSNFSRQTTALNTGQVDVDGSQIGGPAMFSYRSEDDTLSTISDPNYFSPVIRQLYLEDIIKVVGTNGRQEYYVSAIDKDAGTISINT